MPWQRVTPDQARQLHSHGKMRGMDIATLAMQFWDRVIFVAFWSAPLLIVIGLIAFLGRRRD